VSRKLSLQKRWRAGPTIGGRERRSEEANGGSPWQNGKVERFNRTLASGWAYRQVFISNGDRAAALPDFLEKSTATCSAESVCI
jgi:transposase InsO family protein